MKKEEKTNFISLLSDTTFKYLYKNIKTRSWLENIIKGKFDFDISNYELIDNEINTGNNVKDYRLDLKLKKDKTIVIIEMNSTYYNFLEAKNYQYLYREAGSVYDVGESYSGKKVKLILFNNFKNKQLPEMKTGNFLFQDHTHKITIDDIESFEIYLPNFEKVCYDNSEVDISLSLFRATSFEEMKMLTKNPNDIEIIKELERLAMDEEFKIHYDQEAVRRKTENSIRKEAIEQGLQEGIKEGTKSKQIEIAKNMLNDDVTIDKIIEYTGLDISEIEKLQ